MDEINLCTSLNDAQMEMVIMPVDQVREMMLEAASAAFKASQQTILPSPPPDELLTPEETAKLLKVSKVTVWDWGKRGILNPRRIGNQVRYLKSEVIEAARPKKGGEA